MAQANRNHVFCLLLKNITVEALKCGRVYEDSRLKGVFIEELHHPIRFFIQNYWVPTKVLPHKTWKATLSRSSRYKNAYNIAACSFVLTIAARKVVESVNREICSTL